MEKQWIFWTLVALAALLLFLIVLTGSAIKGLLRSEAFKRKIEKSNRGSDLAKAIVLLIALSAPYSSWALSTEEMAQEALEFVPTNGMILGAFIINIVLLYFLWYLKNMLRSLMNVDKTEEELAKETQVAADRWAKVLTDRASLEEEDSILMDHDYDGIQELDNNLPPWWKWGFYASIVFAVIYLMDYHVIGLSDLQIAAYQKDSAQAELDHLAYLESQAMTVDENSVTTLTDVSALAQGKVIFQERCVTCHKERGEGNIGPNLTDDNWLYGGSINEVFYTIKYGTNKGMQSWQEELNPVQMQQVASFVMSLEYVAPPEGKEPEGDLVVPAEAAPMEADSSQTENIPETLTENTDSLQVEG